MKLPGFLTHIDPLTLKYKCFEVLGYTPHRGQDKVHRSLARFRTWAAAARVGKTYAAGMEINAWAMMNPEPQVIWIVGPIYSLAEKVFKVVWNTMCVNFASMFPVTQKSYREKKIMLQNGTIIEAKSCDRPESLLGEGVHLMVVDEASRIPSSIYDEYLINRLSNTMGHMLKISTPKGKGNRFHQDYLLGMKNDPKYKDYESFHSTILDNPLIPREEIEFKFKVLKDLNPEAFKQESLGEFVDFGGSVFPSYQEKVFFKDVKYVDYLPVEASLDIGVRAPTACVFLQRDKKQVRVFKEFYRAGFSSLQNAKKLKPIFEKYNIRRCVIDPREPDARMIYQEIIPSCTFVPGPPDDIVTTLNTFRLHLLVDPKTKLPRIIFDNSMTNLKYEFEVARYPKGETEVPLDKDNHLIACLRYYLHKYSNAYRIDSEAFSYEEKTSMNDIIDETYYGSNDDEDSFARYDDFLDTDWTGDF